MPKKATPASSSFEPSPIPVISTPDASSDNTEPCTVETLVEVKGRAKQPLCSCYEDDPDKGAVFTARRLQGIQDAQRSGTTVSYEIHTREGVRNKT